MAPLERYSSEVLARGDRVIPTARSGISRLQHLADQGAHTLDLDVTASQEELNTKVEEAVTKYGRVDVLVNNAGYMSAGTTEESSDEHFKAVFDVNFFGVLLMIRAVLPYLRKQRSGFIAFLGSPLGWKGIAGAAPYVTSKFALEGVAECVRGEVSSFGIQTTIFDMGNVKTPILNAGRLQYSPRSIDDYNDTMTRFYRIIDYLDNKQPDDPEKAVKVIIDVIKREGVAAGKSPPERLVLGTGMLGYVHSKCDETLESCRKWDAITHSINFDGLTPISLSQTSVVSSKLAQ
ncbi:MAG: hypothetical protein M1820_005458 [Bogoriella megaspora]|nr:MAG: hypothetical protein M1820_005458 [Bogoriella megaspora]